MTTIAARSDPTTWGVSTIQLQRPGHLFMNGAVRPWDEGVIHVASESVVRGLNVLEGLKGYWQHTGELSFRTLRFHHERLGRSARLMHIPFDMSYDDFVAACAALVEVEHTTDHDLYVRATLLVIEGHYTEGNVSDLVLTAYQQQKEPPKPVAVGTSTWQRSPDLAMPIRAKASVNYVVARLARLEGRSRGYEDMILLNRSGRVAEGISAAVLVVRDGVVFSPPATEGSVESITLRVLTELARDEGIPLERRVIERSELYVAEELGLVGTLAEITPIRSVDDNPLPAETPLLDRLSTRYFAAMRGTVPHPIAAMTVMVPSRPG